MNRPKYHLKENALIGETFKMELIQVKIKRKTQKSQPFASKQASKKQAVLLVLEKYNEERQAVEDNDP